MGTVVDHNIALPVKNDFLRVENGIVLISNKKKKT